MSIFLQITKDEVRRCAQYNGNAFLRAMYEREAIDRMTASNCLHINILDIPSKLLDKNHNNHGFIFSKGTKSLLSSEFGFGKGT